MRGYQLACDPAWIEIDVGPVPPSISGSVSAPEDCSASPPLLAKRTRTDAVDASNPPRCVLVAAIVGLLHECELGVAQHWRHLRQGLAETGAGRTRDLFPLPRDTRDGDEDSAALSLAATAALKTLNADLGQSCVCVFFA